MHVARYARVSTRPQEKTETLESPLAALHAYVAAHDHTVWPAHILLDHGVSGSRWDRPALDRLRDQARFGDFEAVLILAPARWARRYPQQWLLLEECQHEGGRGIVMEHPCGDAPHGQLWAHMPGRLAEDARSPMADRTRRGGVPKARKTALLPWAYRVYGSHEIPKPAGLLPRVDSHPDQAAVGRAMCRGLMQAPRTTRQLVKRLHALWGPTRTGQTPVGHAARVRGRLNNPLYSGPGYEKRTKAGRPRQERRRPLHPRTDQ